MTSRIPPFIIVFFVSVLSVNCGISRQFVDPEKEDLKPDREISIRFRGYKKHIKIYTPKDFTPQKAWPVIYYYHCFGNEPNTKIFRAVTEDMGYVIVGMNYVTTDYYETVNEKTADVALEHFDKAFELVSSLITHEASFMAGYSQGGYVTAQLGELRADRLNGLIILAAGRNEYEKPPKYPETIVGKPIFFGIGRDDYEHLPRALKTVELYSRWGADVTLEIWGKTGHTEGWRYYMKDPTRTKNLRTWLNKHS